MMIDDQREVLAFLESPVTYGGTPVARIDTHTAAVFLAGDHAYKLKRAVRFDYLDFSTVERRRRFCEAEITLNRRTAPALYRGVRAITRQPDASLAFDGTGPPVDYVVDMHRFHDDALLDRMAADHRLDVPIIDRLAAHIAAFHLAAERRTDHGGAHGMQWVVDGNISGLREFGTFLDTGTQETLADATRQALQRQAQRLDARRARGYVRHCHGDLHLGNIVMLDGQPTLFDGIEFNDEIACIDVLYDLAFLVMDLWHRGLHRQANHLLNRYLADTGDVDGLALLPLFLSCRAAIRAKTGATAASMATDPSRRDDLQQTARAYFAMALDLLAPEVPNLLAIGGLSGSGKSTVALTVAPSIGRVPGAIVLRSDEIRKRLRGVRPLDRLPASGYTADTTTQVYDTLAATAAAIVATGHSGIVDAVFADHRQRLHIEATASQAAVPFVGVWLEAPPQTLIDRVTARNEDVSDADASIVRGQLSRDPGPLTWHRVDAMRAPEQVVESIRELVRTPA